MRAPDPDLTPAPVYIEAEHTIIGHWEDGRTWMALKGDRMLAQTSNPHDDVFRAALADGAISYRDRIFVPRDHHWTQATPPEEKP